jgi:hypothetical protein
MGQEIQKIGQVLFTDIKKIVGIGANKTGNKIGAVL